MIDKELDHVIAPEKPDEFLQGLWDLNKKYPDYIHCVSFDHVSTPFHKIEECKVKFMEILKSDLIKLSNDLTSKIEDAQENFDEELNKILLLKRKKLKHLCNNVDLSTVKSIDDLINLKSEILKLFI